MNAVQVDENLIFNIARKDAEAFRELYEATSRAVYGFALSILKNREDAEDITHDTYLKVYSSADTYQAMGKPFAWILTITKNLAYNKIRSQKVSEDLDAYDHIIGEEDGVDIHDRMVLEKAMQILEFDERQVVILHALTGMKHKEIAEIMEMPLGTILSKYNRAMNKLKTELEKGGESR